MDAPHLNILQYLYGRFVTNLNIEREIYIIEFEHNTKRLSKLLGRVKYTQMLMPSKHNSEYLGAEKYNMTSGIYETNHVHYTDRHGLPQFGKPSEGNTKNFIIKVHQCCEEYLPKLEKLSIKLNEDINKTEPITIKSQNEQEEDVLSYSIEDVYDFLAFNFNIDVEKNEFISESNKSYITLTGKSHKLWKKDLPKYMIGFMFNFFFDSNKNIQQRILFKYEGQGIKTELYYPESIKALRDKEREIEKGITTDKDFRIFKSNLEKQISVYKE
ncbi:MAG: hypothetical protein CVV25_07775 [Ignavibacteriae bacterium HGW-Ignavibacteriae-4]|jgi:hypothetical protein|nr:MAG: hypothetical protein CVV25_07775 [Ignavibacteriae bacterium HGW-Ignavibacteriae-4]